MARATNGIARTTESTAKHFQPKLREFKGASEIALVTFVVDCEVFTRDHRFFRVGYELMPQVGRALSFTAALRHQS
jgi:hypothetical protein